MSKPESILDLANSRTWKRKVATIVDELFPAEVKREILSRNPKKLFSDTFEYAIDAFSNSGETVQFNELDNRLELLFAGQFTHWRAYHACRPRSLSSYQKNGITPLTRAFVISESVAMLKGHSSEELIRSVAAKIDLESREGNICLFTDPDSPMKSGQNHYLRCGSEIMQLITASLAPRQGILARQGKPVIIQCKIPLSDIHREFALEGYRKMVTRFFQNKMSKGKIGIEILDHCLRTSKCIQPENIEKFIRVDNNTLEQGFHSDH